VIVEIVQTIRNRQIDHYDIFLVEMYLNGIDVLEKYDCDINIIIDTCNKIIDEVNISKYEYIKLYYRINEILIVCFKE